MKKILIVLVLGTLAGCSKSSQKLSVRVEEGEKSNPAVSLVRQVEVKFHDTSGSEKFRKEVAVFGLQQPMSLKSGDLPKDLPQQGQWEANAKTGEGDLVFTGAVGTNGREKDLDIVLTRSEVPAFMKSFELRNEDGITVSTAPSLGSICADLKKLVWSPSKTSKSAPRVTVLSSVKGTSISYEILAGDKRWTGDASIDFEGNAFIEFDPATMAGFGALELRLKNEVGEQACVKLDIQTQVVPVEARFEISGGAGAYANLDNMQPIGIFIITNPNPIPMYVEFHLALLSPSSGCMGWRMDAANSKFIHISVESSISQHFEGIPAKGFARLGIYAYLPACNWNVVKTSGLQILLTGSGFSATGLVP